MNFWKPRLRLFFTDFWWSIDQAKPSHCVWLTEEEKEGISFYDKRRYLTNEISRILSRHFRLQICPDNPDLVVYSHYGSNHLRYACPKVYYTTDNELPDFEQCNLAISPHILNSSKHIYLPNFVLASTSLEDLVRKKQLPVEEVMRGKKHFCSLVVSNPLCKTRNDFFATLNSRKKVDSAGRFMNNMNGKPAGDRLGKWQMNKLRFLKEYKFNICFENSYAHGYCTEKIIDSFLANCIPVYWGDSSINSYISQQSFLRFTEADEPEALIEKILEIDKDPQKHKKMLMETPLIDNKVPPYLTRQTASEQIFSAISRIIC